MALATDIWDLLHALSEKGIEVTPQWVRGLAGLDGNEAADRLVGDATEEQQRDVASTWPALVLPSSDMFES